MQTRKTFGTMTFEGICNADKPCSSLCTAFQIRGSWNKVLKCQAKYKYIGIFWWYNNSLGTIPCCMRCVKKTSGVCFHLSWRQIFSWSEIICWLSTQLSSVVVKRCFPVSLCLHLSFCHSSVTTLTNCFLFWGFDKNFLHCCILSSGCIFLFSIPVYPLSPLSLC